MSDLKHPGFSDQNSPTASHDLASASDQEPAGSFSPSDVPVELRSDEPLDEAETAHEAGMAVDWRSDPSSHRRRAPCGPGIAEAIAWMFGVIGVHLVGMIGALIFVIGRHVVQTQQAGVRVTPEAIQNMLQDLLTTHGLELMTGEMLFFLAAAVVASWVRIRGVARQPLGFRPIPAWHFLLIVMITLPLAQLCGGLHERATGAWESLISGMEGGDPLKMTDVNEALKPLAEQAPVSLLLLVIAVAPAIGEEVIFRGVIGRGLTGRYGVVAGVTLTSMMFAAVHMHPAHVVALLPLAVFIHLVYLSTRSLLAPILLHLLNNSLAVFILKLSSHLEGTPLAVEESMPLEMMVVLAAISLVAAWVLWRTRVEYRLPDGTVWEAGVTSVEVPPANLHARRHYRTSPGLVFGVAVVAAAVYTAMFTGQLAMVIGELATL